MRKKIHLKNFYEESINKKDQISWSYIIKRYFTDSHQSLLESARDNNIVVPKKKVSSNDLYYKNIFIIFAYISYCTSELYQKD